MPKVLITSGPTVEKIDPVRFISNFSSGRMGCELAKAFLNEGYEVVVVSGPVSVSYPSLTQVVQVNSAIEMLNACESEFSNSEVVVCCAAVCDYRPKFCATNKLKKGRDDDALSQIELVKNPDILKTLSSKKAENKIVIGFCAETEDLLKNAKQKLRDKGCDMIVANDVSEGKVFGEDKTAGFIVSENLVKDFCCSKSDLAKIIVEQSKLF